MEFEEIYYAENGGNGEGGLEGTDADAALKHCIVSVENSFNNIYQWEKSLQHHLPGLYPNVSTFCRL